MPDTLGSTSSSFVNGLKTNQGDSWRRLTLSFSPVIARRLRRVGVAPQDTQDLVQEVLRRAVQGISKFQKGSFRGWMATITKRVWLDHVEQRGQQPDAIGGSDHRQRLAEWPAEPLDDEEDFRRADQLLQLLQEIEAEFGPKTWRYFWEVRVEQRTVQEVAQKYGVTVSAVYRAIYRVLKAIEQRTPPGLDSQHLTADDI